MQPALALEDPTYVRREPEKTLLYQVVSQNLETFLEQSRQDDRGLPEYVEKEFRRFLECGILAHGFARFRCDECGHSVAVAFSCKTRGGICNSCAGRRMSDTAAHLVDHVIPHVPVRQFVLSLPIQLRYRLAYDKKLCSDILQVFLRVVYGWYKKKAKSAGYSDPRCGSVTFVQRFGSALNCNVHYHAIVLDGVGLPSEPPSIAPARAPPQEEFEFFDFTRS